MDLERYKYVWLWSVQGPYPKGVVGRRTFSGLKLSRLKNRLQLASEIGTCADFKRLFPVWFPHYMDFRQLGLAETILYNVYQNNNILVY